MAQAIETPEQISVASGTVAAFPTVFTFEFADEVVVSVDAGAGFVDRVLGVDYELTPGDWLTVGASVVFRPSALPAAGHRVRRGRRTRLVQASPFGDDETFRPQSNEAAFDRQTRMAQDLSAGLARAVMVEPGDTPPSPAELRQLAGGIEGILDEASERGAEAGAAASAGRLLASGENAAPTILDALPFIAPGPDAVARPVSSKLGEWVSLDDFDGVGTAKLNAALAAVGDRGQTLFLGPDQVLHLDTAPTGAVNNVWADGPFTRSGAYAGNPGGILIQTSGTGLLFNPVYIGQWSRPDGTFPFEEAFLAEGAGTPTVFRSLSSAVFAVASPNGSNAAVFTSRSSDGGSIGSGYALASYVINDRTLASHGSIHGMWAYHSISVRKAGAGTTFGVEPGVANRGSIETRHPYYAYADGLTVSAWLASGAEIPGTNPITAFAAFVYNGNSAMTGLLVTANALADRGGGYGELLALPEKTYIGQYNDLGPANGPIGQLCFQMAMGVTVYERGSRLTFDDAGMSLASIASGANWLFVNDDDLIAGPVSSPFFSASDTGLRAHGKPTAASHVLMYGEAAGLGEAVVAARGSETNVWLVLAGQGNGGVKLPGSPFAANDAEAAGKGVPLNGAYRNTSNQNALTIRVA